MIVWYAHATQRNARPGQVLATKVRKTLSAVRKDGQPAETVLSSGAFNYSTTRMALPRNLN